MIDLSTTWRRGGGNFLSAGVDTVLALFENFIDKHSNGEFFDDEKLSIFLDNSINRYLYSFGTGLSYKTRKMSPKHSSRIASQIKKITSRQFLKNTKLYIDSGGFQVAMGAVETKDMPNFIDTYHKFVEDNHNMFSYAFSLDLPPGPSSAAEIFESYDQIEELNRLSYRETCQFPQNIKDKMIYIHHFRTPSLYDTWSKFLWEENLADGFKNFATGGLVANLATDMTIPVILYTIPLSEILKYAIEKGFREFNFHVLGGANFIDVFYHKLFSYHIKRVHNVKVNITYDSSALFKGLAIGRFVPVFNSDNILVKMDLRSNSLQLRFDGLHTIQDTVYKLLNEIADEYGFKNLNPKDHPIYCKERGTFNRAIHMYLICYMLRAYRLLELISEDYVQEIYPLFEQEKFIEFDNKCAHIAQLFNQGKSTKKQRAKTASIYRSLQVLSNLDRDYNRHLIHKFMSNDDISVMAGSGMLKFE
jgi:hypothetical protein